MSTSEHNRVIASKAVKNTIDAILKEENVRFPMVDYQAIERTHYKGQFEKMEPEEGDMCGNDGCIGRLEYMPYLESGCTCHMHPPCVYCTTVRLTCNKCGYYEDGSEG